MEKIINPETLKCIWTAFTILLQQPVNCNRELRSENLPKQACTNTKNSGKCRIFTFFILKNEVMKPHHEHGFVERPVHAALKVFVGDCRRLKADAHMLIQWHILRVTPGPVQCNWASSTSNPHEMAQSADKTRIYSNFSDNGTFIISNVNQQLWLKKKNLIDKHICNFSDQV